MDKLPTEILNRTFIQLELSQRLECLTVCRSWWMVLDTHSLFYDIKIANEDDRFSRMMAKFEQLPDCSAQVKEFEIRLAPDTRFNRRKLLKAFPNLFVLRVEPGEYLVQTYNTYFRLPMDLPHLKPKLEFLSDFHRCELLCQLVHSNLCGRIKVLDLRFFYGGGTRTTLALLKHLPALKKLSVALPQVKIADLEGLHENTPSLEEFALEDIHVEEGNVPPNITPVTSIRRLSFSRSYPACMQVLIQLYQHMTKKYPNITASQYKDDKLIHYSTSNMKEIYPEALVDFYKLIGPTQSELVLYRIPNGINPLEILDSVGSRMKSLTFRYCEGEGIYQYFTQSNQSKYIEKLDIQSHFYYPLGNFIKNMTTLTQLSIYIADKLSLSDYLDACPPSVTHLAIKSNNLIVKPYTRRLHSIESLTIGNEPTPRRLGRIISTCFPNMVKLHLVADMTRSLMITLENPELQSVTISENRFTHNKNGFGFSLKTPSQTQVVLVNSEDNEDNEDNEDSIDFEDLTFLWVTTLREMKLVSNPVGSNIELLPC